MSQAPTITLSLNGQAKINVPDSINLMTRFVLEEQGDWFEDELPFVRALLQPGMQAIDIGANVGCYALSMAAAVKSGGKVWAFEPCADTFNLLSSSKDLNQFNHLQLVQAGLSEKQGQATLYQSSNSELNSLHPRANREQVQETIRLVTLDDCKNKYGWRQIDFLKLDAEGEECNIIKGGLATLNELSPLVMFELKHGGDVHRELIDDFHRLGYNCYSLNKSQQLLLPFDSEDIEGFQLNLFCCKTDTARKLEQRGLLSTLAPTPLQPAKGFSAAIAHIKRAQDTQTDKLQRISHWQAAHSQLRNLHLDNPDNLELLSGLCRCALELGQRREAVGLALKLINLTQNSVDLSNDQEIVAPLARYDQLTNPEVWLRQAAIELYSVHHAYSCYFSGNHALSILTEFNAGAYATHSSRQREQTIRKRSA